MRLTCASWLCGALLLAGLNGGSSRGAGPDEDEQAESQPTEKN